MAWPTRPSSFSRPVKAIPQARFLLIATRRRIPAELLTRRPDVRRAERRLAAQCARIGIAESELYPRIAITGAIGYGSKNLMIVDELAECGERSVQELTAMIGTDGSTVSRHLSTLKNAGVVASRKSGTTVYYRLRMKCIPVFLNCVESMLREDAEMKAHI
jgi:DNA-binding transcriptional ArsR family regulator